MFRLCDLDTLKVVAQEHVSDALGAALSWTNGRLDNSAKSPDRGLFERLLWMLGGLPLVRELLLESRSFLHRIESLCKERWWLDGIALGPAFGNEEDAFGFLTPCAQTERRSAGIEKLQSKYAWASSTDMAIFLLGFDAACTLSYTSDNESQQVVASNSPFSGLTPLTPTAIEGPSNSN